MRSDPEGRELCRLSAGYGHKDACGRMGTVLNDPKRSWLREDCAMRDTQAAKKIRTPIESSPLSRALTRTA